MFTLHTSRLVLRDLVASDWLAIYALSREAAVTRYQTWLRLSTEAEAQIWVANAIYHNRLQPRNAYNLAVVHQLDVIGWLGWGRPTNRELGDYDFGYALLPAAWGHGFMTEALHAAITYMFHSLHAQRVFGECASMNVASARAMEKVGMTLSAMWIEQNQTTREEEEHRRYTIDVTAWQNAGESLSAG
jgi:ribosomal-protein-alanine N-acetyltransferase